MNLRSADLSGADLSGDEQAKEGAAMIPTKKQIADFRRIAAESVASDVQDLREAWEEMLGEIDYHDDNEVHLEILREAWNDGIAIALKELAEPEQ